MNAGKPEDSSRKKGAVAGSSPPGDVPVKKRGFDPRRKAVCQNRNARLSLQLLKTTRIFKITSPHFLRKAPESSSLEPKRIVLPSPGQEVSRASPQYQRLLEKLNNEVELYKLHVMHYYHYHMSSAQFRRRASMLGLPGDL